MTGVDRHGKGSPQRAHHAVPSFDWRGGSCGVTIWGGCVDDGATAVVAAADAAVEDWLLPFDDLAVAVVPEPEAAPDPDPDPDPDPVAGADDGIEGLAPFRAVGVVALPPPLEEASRWSSALSASALPYDPNDPPIRQLQAWQTGKEETV